MVTNVAPSDAAITSRTRPNRRSPRTTAKRPNLPGSLGAWIWLAIIIRPIYYVVVTASSAPLFHADVELVGSTTSQVLSSTRLQVAQ